MGGEGTVTLNGQTAAIRAGDAVPVRLGEAKAFATTGSAPLEMMVIGVARDLEAKRAFVQATAPRRR